MKRSPIKSHKHKRTQATDISPEVKRIVYERDGGLCVWCKSPNGMPEAHYISRAQGGLGIEENILTLCRISSTSRPSCHDLYDKGPLLERETMKEFFAAYLAFHYPGWDESKLIYKKEF